MSWQQLWGMCLAAKVSTGWGLAHPLFKVYQCYEFHDAILSSICLFVFLVLVLILYSGIIPYGAYGSTWNDKNQTWVSHVQSKCLICSIISLAFKFLSSFNDCDHIYCLRIWDKHSWNRFKINCEGWSK